MEKGKSSHLSLEDYELNVLSPMSIRRSKKELHILNHSLSDNPVLGHKFL